MSGLSDQTSLISGRMPYDCADFRPPDHEFAGIPAARPLTRHGFRPSLLALLREEKRRTPDPALQPDLLIIGMPPGLTPVAMAFKRSSKPLQYSSWSWRLLKASLVGDCSGRTVSGFGAGLSLPNPMWAFPSVNGPGLKPVSPPCSPLRRPLLNHGPRPGLDEEPTLSTLKTRLEFIYLEADLSYAQRYLIAASNMDT